MANHSKQGATSGRRPPPPASSTAAAAVGGERERPSAGKTPDEDAELAATAEDLVDRLLANTGADSGTPVDAQRAIDEFGLDVQQRAAQRCRMLHQPIHQQAKGAGDGAAVTARLERLRQCMAALEPRDHRLDHSGLRARLPAIATPLERYLRKFEATQGQLAETIEALARDRTSLERDNITLADDREALGALLAPLQRQIALGHCIDRRLLAALAIRSEGERQHGRIEEALRYPLRQRIADLQQQLTIGQQAWHALEVIIRTNRELIRGIDRVLHVTMTALDVAAATALALANRRLVLDRIKATRSAIGQTRHGEGHSSADRPTGPPKGDGTRPAAETSAGVGALGRAFGDVFTTLDEIGRGHHAAQPELAAQIEHLDTVATRAPPTTE